MSPYSEGGNVKVMKMAIPILLMVTLVFTSILIVDGSDGQDPVDPPSRGLLGYKETVNISFPKPTFYDGNDPHNNEDVEPNSWEDIAFVVMIQNGNKITKTENQGSGSETATCADIYQAVFVTLDGKTVSTGTQQRVMVEDFTATWCTYCTGVIGAMNRLDMDETMFPDKYIGVEWHSGGGTYGTGQPYTSALERRNFYSLQGGIPRYVIDGVDPWVGGSSSANNTAIDDRIRGSISNRNTPAMISIVAHAGHTASNAWVEFTFTVESDTFGNNNVEAHIALVQDAYPRRHGTNANARLGWIGQDLETIDVLQKESPLVQIDDNRMANDIDDLGYVQGELEVQWQAQDKEDGSALTVDLYYARGRGEWVPIELDVPNTGRYKWDTTDPRVPDGDDYKVKVVATDSDDMMGESILQFEFEINNPDPPSLVIAYPSDEAEVMTGNGEVRWWSLDEEQDAVAIYIDIEISSDLGSTFEPFATDLPNSGSYVFDTTELPDGTEYVLRVTATDPTYLSNTTDTVPFTIFNNDPPENTITFPAEGDEVSGTIDIMWDVVDEEDGPEDVLVDLSIMNVNDGIWQKMARSLENSGSYELDTTTLENGDGEYRVRIMVKDTHGEFSEPHVVGFRVYNPDLPQILNTQTPRSPLSGTVEFAYTLTDPDLGETAQISPTFHISSDGENWDLLAESVQNTGTFSLNTLELEDGGYQLRITVADPVLTGQFTQFIYPRFEVNNPDEPTISPVGVPPAGSNNTGDISLSWSGEDADGDNLKYYLYYSEASLISWMPIYDAQGLSASSYIWNTSEVESGDYVLRIVVKDGSKANLQAEFVTQSFHIHVDEKVNDDTTGGDSKTKTSDGDDSTLILLIIAIGGAFILILVVVGMLLLVKKTKTQQALIQMPAPMPPANAIPPAQTVNQLQAAPQPQVNPAPAPQQQLPPRQPQQTYVPPVPPQQ